MPTLKEQVEATVALLVANEIKLDDFINGDENTTVTTPQGVFPSLAKMVKDFNDRTEFVGDYTAGGTDYTTGQTFRNGNIIYVVIADFTSTTFGGDSANYKIYADFSAIVAAAEAAQTAAEAAQTAAEAAQTAAEAARDTAVTVTSSIPEISRQQILFAKLDKSVLVRKLEWTDIVLAGDFALNGWKRFTDFSTEQTLWSEDGTSSSNFVSVINDSQVRIRLAAGTSHVVALSSALPLDVFGLLSVVRSGTTITVYWNGAPIGSVTESNTMTLSAYGLRSSATSAAAVDLAWTSIHDAALTSGNLASIAADFSYEISALSADLQLYAQCPPEGRVWFDRSGNGNDMLDSGSGITYPNRNFDRIDVVIEATPTTAVFSSALKTAWLYADGTFSTTAPTGDDKVIPTSAIIEDIIIENTGAGDLIGLALLGDSTPSTNPVFGDLPIRFTERQDIMAGEVVKLTVNPSVELADISTPTALGWSIYRVTADTTAKITVRLRSKTLVGDETAQIQQRAQKLQHLEQMGLIDEIQRVAMYPLIQGDWGIEEALRAGDGLSTYKEMLERGEDRNLQRYTETPDDATWYDATTLSIDTADTVDFRGITLKRTTGADFGALLESDWTAATGANNPVLVVGERYLVSFFVMSAGDGDVRFYCRSGLSGTAPGHGQRWATKTPRRVWFVVEAKTTERVGTLDDAEINMGTGGADDFAWFNPIYGAYTSDAQDIYLGGFQVEKLDDNAYTDGIVWIGDSTISNGAHDGQYPAFNGDLRTSNKPDQIRYEGVTRYFEWLTNTTCFNRAIGGATMGGHASRWADDITAVATAGNAKYCVIQGGINDLRSDFDAGTGTELADLKTATETNYNLAVTDGLIPVMLTITPNEGAWFGTRNDTRIEFNEWLKKTYPFVIDICIPIQAMDERSIFADSEWMNDNTHYKLEAQMAVARYMAASPIWDFLRPSAYQPAATTTLAKQDQVLASPGSGTTPSDTDSLTPTIWADLEINGSTYKVPLYQ